MHRKVQECLEGDANFSKELFNSQILPQTLKHITVRVGNSLFVCWFTNLSFKLCFKTEDLLHIFPPFPFTLIRTLARLFVCLHQLTPLQTSFVSHYPRIKTRWIKTIIAFKVAKQFLKHFNPKNHDTGFVRLV